MKLEILVSAISGMLLGGIIGYSLANKKLQKEYDEKMNAEYEEINALKKKLRHQVNEDLSEDYRGSNDDDVEEEPKRRKGRNKKDKEYHKYSERHREKHPEAYEHPREDDTGESVTNQDIDDREGPVIMTLEEVNDLPHQTWYTEITCTYFEKDDTFADDHDEVMEDIEAAVGEEAIRIMRETDQEELYVVNEKTYTIYEIIRDLDSYESLIGGNEV